LAGFAIKRRAQHRRRASDRRHTCCLPSPPRSSQAQW
jgi:hypothetical protein